MTESVPEPAGAAAAGPVTSATAPVGEAARATATAQAGESDGAGPEGAAEGTAAAQAPPVPAPAGRPPRRDWRGKRPFWGGLLVLLGGAEILFTLRSPLPVVLHIGMEGIAGYLVPAVMVLCGLLILFNPAQRLFYSVLAVLASLGSWITSNLGGFLVGMLLGLVGSSLTFGWLPDQPLRRGRQRREDRREQRRAAGPSGPGRRARSA